jgi:ribonuclease HI
MIDIYADGGCNPNPGVGGWGIVTYQNGKEAWTECGGDMDTTNNRMEMQAIIEALKMAAGQPCNIFSDSQLCVSTLTSWAKSWERKGWKKSAGGEIKNLDLVKEAYALYLQSKARIIWVKGHSGVKGNERADRLANEGRTNIINSRILESV